MLGVAICHKCIKICTYLFYVQGEMALRGVKGLLGVRGPPVSKRPVHYVALWSRHLRKMLRFELFFFSVRVIKGMQVLKAQLDCRWQDTFPTEVNDKQTTDWCHKFLTWASFLRGTLVLMGWLDCLVFVALRYHGIFEMLLFSDFYIMTKLVSSQGPPGPDGPPGPKGDSVSMYGNK